MEKQIYVLVGNYGCGKTELSLNMAIQAARAGKKCALVDVDIVNPYFRSGFHKELLDKEGIKLIAARQTLEAADVPVVAPEVLTAFDSDFDLVLFDVGGDPVGATALGQYLHKFQQIKSTNLKVIFVVNVFRPLTQTVEDICEMLEKIQNASRLKVTTLFNNAHLVNETTLQHLKQGNIILQSVAKRMQLPIQYYGIKKGLYAMFNRQELDKLQGKPVLLDTYTRLEWIDFIPDKQKGRLAEYR